jgi:tight adherence protein B
LITRSGASVTVGAIVLTTALLAVVAAAVAYRLSHFALAAIPAASIAGSIPYLYLKFKLGRRMAQFEEQFPEAIDLIARALRAGHALPTALELVGQEIPNPAGAEFKVLFDQQNYGLSLTEALNGFAARVPLLDARFFVTAVLTQREVGGNLSEVLDKLSAVIRERFKVKRQVKAVSAHGRITGVVLSLMPLVLGVIMTITSPDQMRVLIEDPIGVRMLIGGVVMQCIGAVWIKQVANVEY